MPGSLGRPFGAFRQDVLCSPSPVSVAICRGARSGAGRSKQVRYSTANRRILITMRDSLWGSAMPTLLVAASTDALGACPSISRFLL